MMKADIRTAARREAERVMPLTGGVMDGGRETWHRGFAHGAVWGAARVTPAREQIARKLYDIRDDPYDVTEWEELDSTDREVYYCQADAVLALMEELAEGES